MSTRLSVLTILVSPIRACPSVAEDADDDAASAPGYVNTAFSALPSLELLRARILPVTRLDSGGGSGVAAPSEAF